MLPTHVPLPTMSLPVVTEGTLFILSELGLQNVVAAAVAFTIGALLFWLFVRWRGAEDVD